MRLSALFQVFFRCFFFLCSSGETLRTSQLVCDYLTLLQVPALRERLREPPGGRSVDKTARWLRLAGRLVDCNAYP